MSINLPELTADVNAHQNLPDQPTLSANELKQAWDQPASDIKYYLNNILIPQVESQVGTEITNGVNAAKAYTDSAIGAIDLDADNINYDNTSSGLTADNVQDAVDELESDISALESDVSDFTANIGGIATTTVSVAAVSLGAQSTKVTNKTSTMSGGTYIPINAFLSAKTQGPTATGVGVNEINNIAQNSVTVQFVQTNGAGSTQTAPGGTATIHWLRIK